VKKLKITWTTKQQRLAIAGVGAVVAVLLGWLLFVAVPRGPYQRGTALAPQAAEATTPVRKIKAHLFYVAEDGAGLTSVERDVPYGEGTVDQARAIVTAQLEPVTAPLLSAVPDGTMLRALFVTADGQAYVDLSDQIVNGHPGGSLNELLTVYTVVHALTTNLPAITAVQLLVNGQEIDTLAGHVDLRRPLVKNAAIIE
jgi:spore germination protein GerM